MTTQPKLPLHWGDKHPDLDKTEYEAVRRIAVSLYEHLQDPEVKRAVDEVNKPRVHSAKIQATVLKHATELQFHSERKGIFETYETPGLRPDYFLSLPEHHTGIIFEVERGKTTINNMDLLDLWKCHICVEAHHLFLMVPFILRQNDGDKVTRPYEYVQKRLPSFFKPDTYLTGVRTCWLFGY